MLKRNLKNCNTSPQLSFPCTVHSNSHSNELLQLLILLFEGYMHSWWSTWTINVVHTQHTFVNCYASHGTLEGVLVTVNCSSCKDQHPGTYKEKEESNWENLGGNWVGSLHLKEHGAAKILSVRLGIVLRMYISPWFQLPPWALLRLLGSYWD